MGTTEAVTYLCPNSHDNDDDTVSESGLGAWAPGYPNATLAPAGGWSLSYILGEMLALPDAMSAAGHPTAHNGGGGRCISLFSLSKQETLQKIPGLCPGLAEKRICNRTTTFETHPLLSPRW